MNGLSGTCSMLILGPCIAYLVGTDGWSEPADSPVRGQTVYVPAYSEVPSYAGTKTVGLTVTLCIRNVNQGSAVTVSRIDYYNSKGARVRSFLTAPLMVSRLASHEVVISEGDKEGGISASFIVQWEAKEPVQAPLIETVMVGATDNRGLSFVGRSRVLETKSRQ